MSLASWIIILVIGGAIGYYGSKWLLKLQSKGLLKKLDKGLSEVNGFLKSPENEKEVIKDGEQTSSFYSGGTIPRAITESSKESNISSSNVPNRETIRGRDDIQESDSTRDRKNIKRIVKLD